MLLVPLVVVLPVLAPLVLVLPLVDLVDSRAEVEDIVAAAEAIE